MGVQLPKRIYLDGDKKTIGVRLPGELVKHLEKIALESGWTLSDVVQTALDFYVQDQEKEKDRPPKSKKSP